MSAVARPGPAAPAAPGLRGVDGSRCARAWRDAPYRERLTLRDGRRVLLRPAHRSDAAALQAFFAALSPHSRLMRFHGVVNRVPQTVLHDFSTQRPGRHVAIVALADTDDGSRVLLAEARYVVDAQTREVEFALAVADDWQGQGLGRALLRRLAAHAAAEGHPVLEGRVRPDNTAMLGLLRDLGIPLHERAHEVAASWPL